ncbi:MAG: WecB/TagA/CpsF family glycosyltransferase [Eubacteriales bacterium]
MELNQLKYCEILDTNINVINMKDAVTYISEHLEELKGNYICVSNVHTTVMSYRNEAYRKIQNGGAMALPDGKPLELECKRRGFKDAGRVPGPDLMPNIFALSEETGYTHYFYGSTLETLEKLQQNLVKEFPQLKIVGMYSPPFRPLTEEEDCEIIQQINDVKADFVWVGLGAPKQEEWMAQHKNKIQSLMIGVGAGFDFHAGTVKRAPYWMQEYCLEWLYRLMQDPKRLLTRYVDTNVSFMYYLWKVERVKKRESKKRIAKKKDSSKFKIAMLGHKRIPSREGGVEIVVNELVKRMIGQGHAVDVYNRSGYHVSGKEYEFERSKEYLGSNIITIPTFRNGKLNAIVYSFLASVRVLFTKYDIVHYHAEGPCAMLWIPKMFGKRIVVTIHGLDWQRAKWGGFATKVLKFGEKMAAKYADEIIVLSENVKEYFYDTYHRETHFIPNGISKPEIIPCNIIKKRFGLEKDGYILFLARLVPEKGVHYLIEAYEKLNTDKKLVIAGGSSHSIEYVEMIEKQAKTNENIIMTGFIQGEILEELYSNAYVFVLPSEIEGMALSLLEAMSYGNCCVVSDICENTDVVDGHGVAFKSTDVDSLAKELQELLNNPDNVEKYKSMSSEYICNKYSWDDVVEETTKVYRGK